jgi:hypothetical protein
MNFKALAAGVLMVTLLVTPAIAQQGADPDLRLFFEAASADRDTANEALEQIGQNWKDGYSVMLIEWLRFLSRGEGVSIGGQIAATGQGTVGLADTRDIPTSTGPLEGRNRFQNRQNPRVQARERIVAKLEDFTGQDFGDDLDGWRQWARSLPYDPHQGLGAFKANVYAQIDPGFRNFFQGNSTVRLDLVDWGGVKVSGIPALDHPETVAADEADYLADLDVVFGFFRNGEARAYPKRILAWHELAWDKVGGEEITLVYCTLCGTVIPYSSNVGGRNVKFDTSGLLYESNKLMFDDLTFTLWSSLTGEPVIGRMAGSGVRLVSMPVVTTTWGEWRRQHPETTVLSLDTGHERDYGEGVAYQDYFATDDVMFGVSQRDSRLANKDEILAIRFPRREGGDDALAIAADFLSRNPLYQTAFRGRELLILTSPDGANRVYASPGITFVEKLDGNRVQDSEGRIWVADEEGIVEIGDPNNRLPRLVAFRAFWFGWYAQYPETDLIAD